MASEREQIVIEASKLRDVLNCYVSVCGGQDEMNSVMEKYATKIKEVKHCGGFYKENRIKLLMVETPEKACELAKDLVKQTALSAFRADWSI